MKETSIIKLKTKKEDLKMAKVHAFVSGPVEEVQKLAIYLMDACETAKLAVEEDEHGQEIEVEYKDGRIQISYVPEANLEKWRSED
jgi:hypothetical protein